ncbi:unnamed protein product [Choristocarpus tenellus]
MPKEPLQCPQVSYANEVKQQTQCVPSIGPCSLVRVWLITLDNVEVVHVLGLVNMLDRTVTIRSAELTTSALMLSMMLKNSLFHCKCISNENHVQYSRNSTNLETPVVIPSC